MLIGVTGALVFEELDRRDLFQRIRASIAVAQLIAAPPKVFKLPCILWFQGQVLPLHRIRHQIMQELEDGFLLKISGINPPLLSDALPLGYLRMIEKVFAEKVATPGLHSFAGNKRNEGFSLGGYRNAGPAIFQHSWGQVNV